LRPLLCAPQSFSFSINTTRALGSRRRSSRATPKPMTPPPMIKKSQVSIAAVPLMRGAAFWTIGNYRVEDARVTHSALRRRESL
jgi:hypothetical protein